MYLSNLDYKFFMSYSYVGVTSITSRLNSTYKAGSHKQMHELISIEAVSNNLVSVRPTQHRCSHCYQSINGNREWPRW